jgi:hypothetical protein
VLCATNTKSDARGRTDGDCKPARNRTRSSNGRDVVITRGNKPPSTVSGARRTTAERHRRSVLGSCNLGLFRMLCFNLEVAAV